MTPPAVYIKAILGAVIAGLSALATAAEDGGINLAEGLVAAVGALSALVVVYQVPNADG